MSEKPLGPGQDPEESAAAEPEASPAEPAAFAAPTAHQAPPADAPHSTEAPSAYPAAAAPTFPPAPGYDQPAQGYNQQAPGYDQPAQGYAYAPGYSGVVGKNKVLAGLLGIFLGIFGVHNFYLGYTGKAVTQLLITVLSLGFLSFISGIWGLIEGILILVGSDNFRTDAKGVPLVS